MHPILIKLGKWPLVGEVNIHTYGFLLAIGVLSAIALAMYHSKKEGLDTRVIADFVFYAILVGLVGAKLWLFITEIGYYLREPSRIPSLLTSAGTFFGGLIFGTLFVVWYVRKHGLDIRRIGDALIPSVALAHFFGRMGCFFAGCCWGREAHGCPIAVTFNNPEATTGIKDFLGVPLYPTQLAEAILNLINFFILFIVFKKRKFKGQVLALYIFNYSLIRLFVEYFRGDDDRGYVIGNMHEPFTSLSIPQVVSIAGIIIAIILWSVFKRKAEEELKA